VLRQLPSQEDPHLLVGLSTGDDAAVYRLREDLALVQTVDFFPPIVDDPYAYGAIAAANALSDVYAMGGRPILALNIVGFPVELPVELLGQVLRGGAEKAREAGVLIVGGHTIDDKEPKYGLAVTGVIKPGHQVTNVGAKVGDLLILTKPLGTGVIATAAKNEAAEPGVLEEAIRVMSTLNKKASEVMVSVGVHACTDITGFGLVGHLLGMTTGPKVGARLYLSQVPFIQGAWQAVEAGFVPGGTSRNMEAADGRVRWHAAVSAAARVLLCDAQTSGGLLMAVSPRKSKRLVKELKEAGVPVAAVIGEVTPDSQGTIEVVP
jgi:selenide,water dikinase